MINLRLGNCHEIIEEYPNNYFDVIITSPPYNLGNKHHTRDKYHTPYPDDLPEEEYQRQQREILIKMLFRLKQKGSIFYNHKNRIKDGVSITPYEWILPTLKGLNDNFNMGARVRQELIWNNGTPNFDPCRFYPRTERIYWITKDKNPQFSNKLKSSDILQFLPCGTNKEHTRTFPEEMVSTLLINCQVQAQNQLGCEALNVLDPYMGEGTVGRVCASMGHNFVGIEINKDYFNLAKENISENM